MTTPTAKLAGTTVTLSAKQAQRFYDELGASRMAIVELTSDSRTETLDGRQVKLIVTTLEVVEEAGADDHLRELARALYRVREPQQLTIDDNASDIDAPTVAEVLEQHQAAGLVEWCDYPGCTLTAEHDGDHHQIPAGATPAT